MAGNILYLLFVFALFSSFFLKKTFVYGAVEAIHHVVEMKSLAPASTCYSTTEGVHGMQIVKRYGPCSSFGQENSSSDSRHILIKDQTRVRSLNSQTSNKYATNGLREGTRLPLSNREIGAGNYVVKAGFGTPKRDFNLIFDTGSDLTWLKCGSNYYQPSASSTFANATCEPGTSCSFSNIYGDKSNVSGYYIQDTLTISPSDVFSNFVFGCGLQIIPDFGSADGLLGVGQDGPLSLISQTSTNFAKVFCYCLPRSDSSNGYLLLGMQALVTCQTTTSTPLKRDANRPSFYYVNLLGITIGSHRIDTSPWKTIMDSGTVITRLPSPVYSALRSEFVKFMSKYSRAPSTPLLDTCYNLEGFGNVTVPKMALQFENIKVDLDPSALIWRESDSQVCLAFAGN